MHSIPYDTFLFKVVVRFVILSFRVDLWLVVNLVFVECKGKRNFTNAHDVSAIKCEQEAGNAWAIQGSVPTTDRCTKWLEAIVSPFGDIIQQRRAVKANRLDLIWDKPMSGPPSAFSRRLVWMVSWRTLLTIQSCTHPTGTWARVKRYP